MAAYQPHNWQAGQTITAERLNALEQGLAKTQDETGEPVEALTNTENGLMSSADKVKLDGIATGANKYVHPPYTPKESGLYKITVTKKVWRVLSQRRHHTDRCGQRVGDAVG